jgi:hypothetical protein
LNVSDAPAASVVCGHEKMQTFDFVVADAPLPTSGPSVAPEGTASLVQWSPLGMLNCTAKPVTLLEPSFLNVMVPQ